MALAVEPQALGGYAVRAHQSTLSRSPVLTRRSVLAASLAVLTSCSSDKNPTGLTGLTGTVGFSYSGAISGTYSATGTIPANIETSAWAAGILLTSDGVIAVESAAPRTASSHDFIILAASRTTAGTAPIDDNCTSDCTVAFFSFGVANGAGTSVLQECVITVGSIVITEVTPTRVRGTFSGTGECLANGTGNPQAFTVTNGSFDVALLSDIP